MSGVNEINKKYIDKINSILDKQPDYFRSYINFMNDVSVRTKYNYLNNVISFVNNINKPIENITFDDFNNYIAQNKYKEDGSEKSASFQITVYSALKKFSEYLYVSRKIKENYMLYIKRPKFKESQETITKRENGYLTEKEIKKFIKNIDKMTYISKNIAEEWICRDKAIIYLFLNTGIRCSALLSIDIDDINFDNKTLVVTDKGTKVRSFDISDSLCDVLKEWLIAREALLGENDKDNRILFISNRRTRMTAQTIYKTIKKYGDCIEGKNITPHKLRATYGTQLYNKTGDIYFVQDCMGHTNPKTTELYVREKKQNTKRASEIISKLI